MRKQLLTVIVLAPLLMTACSCGLGDEERVTEGTADQAGDESGETGKPEPEAPPAPAAGEPEPDPTMSCVKALTVCKADLAECTASK